MTEINAEQAFRAAYDHLHAGRYQSGFRLLEYRWHPSVMNNTSDPYGKHPENVTAWQGESLYDKTICVQMEQGYGDMIQFARFLPALKMLGAKKLIVMPPTSLFELLGQMECIDILTNDWDGEIASSCDYWIGSLSLPYYISLMPEYVRNLYPITKEKVALSEGYFEVQPSNIPKKVGVNWVCSKTFTHYMRSISSEEMLKITGDDCYSLNPETPGYFQPLPDDGWKENFVKFAAHVKACKAVVTVDTVTAHVAGALGVKCFVLLPKKEHVDWRWQHDNWYDSVVRVPYGDYDKIPDLLRRL